MSEVLRYTRSETAQYLEEIGYPINEERIKQVYPIHFPKRRVLRIAGPHAGADSILKVRPLNEEGKGERELKRLNLLFESYRHGGCKFPEVEEERLEDSGFIVFKMSYLGPNLGELGNSMDLIELGYAIQDEVVFNGFSKSYAEYLLHNLERSHRQFAKEEGYIHGDLFQGHQPNNVVYFEPYDHLFFVDAEALGEVTNARRQRFDQQFELVTNWVMDNLVI
jgi:hypothetical protein